MQGREAGVDHSYLSTLHDSIKQLRKDASARKKDISEAEPITVPEVLSKLMIKKPDTMISTDTYNNMVSAHALTTWNACSLIHQELVQYAIVVSNSVNEKFTDANFSGHSHRTSII